MPHSAGDNLGPYEILAPIGAGGMGEVFKARDTRLTRDVAIKTSATQFSERFEREARAIAALNHSNICHLYDVGPDYLVMEFVEGVPLKGPLPLDQALHCARQIASALEAAHEKQITHRDLKPGNILVTADGVIKVLDFGLAKIGEPTRTESNPENSPTVTLGATVAGTILGTAAYMAPEQARGKTVDKRADIWAFGVVLYEILTGERLFQGEDITETLAAVVTKEPDLDKVPREVRRLLQKCLQKDPRNRLRDIADAWDLLDSASPAAPGKNKAAWLPWAIAAILLLALVPGNVSHYLIAPPPQPAVNTTLLPPENAEFAGGPPAISPDGTRIVFAAREKGSRSHLWLRRLDTAAAQPVPGTEGASFPFWSPDSRWVAFGQNDKLKKIDIHGGPPVSITGVEGAFRGGSWNADGVILFAGNGNAPAMRVAASGGTATVAAAPGQRVRFPWFLPDGRHFLYSTPLSGDLPVQIGSLDEPGKPPKVVAQAHSPAVYAQGHLLFLRERTLMAQPFDADRLETTGEALPIAEEIGTTLTNTRLGEFSVSPAGLLAFLSTATASESQLVWKDRQGKVLGKFGERIPAAGSFAISPDQKNVAIGFGAPGDLWIYEAAKGLPTRFTFDAAADHNPVWSADGKTVYFASKRGKGRVTDNLYRKAANGSGSEELLLDNELNKVPTSISPDGRLLLFHQEEPKTGGDLWVLPLVAEAGTAKPRPRVFLQTPFAEINAEFSPDGQWVAYESGNESGQFEIYAAPFANPGGKRQISSGGGAKPRWRRDGKEIYYHTMDGQLMAAEVVSRNGTLEVGQVRKLFDGIALGRGYLYDVSADGQKFLVADREAARRPPMTLLQNWTATLRK